MSTYSDLVDRVGATTRRLDLVADAALERARYDARQMRRADDAECDEERERVRKDAARCREHQSRYDEAFAKHGKRAPEPAADAHPPEFRRDLFRIAQTMLPSDHELAGFDPRQVGSSAIVELERQLLEALDREAEEPTGDNVPGPGQPLREVTKVDSTNGSRVTRFYGTEHFIKQLSRPARRVLRLVDPRDGKVLLGRPWSLPR
jgi:hypothetical protein